MRPPVLGPLSIDDLMGGKPRIEFVGKLVRLDFQIPVRLRIDPTLSFRTEGAGKTQGGIGRNRTLARDDLPDA
jgi:hypothetical protein